MSSFEDGRMMYFVSKAWNGINLGARDTSNVIVDHQFQEETTTKTSPISKRSQYSREWVRW